MKTAKNRGMARARAVVARKLAVILHRMCCDEAELRFSHDFSETTALALG